MKIMLVNNESIAKCPTKAITDEKVNSVKSLPVPLKKA